LGLTTGLRADVNSIHPQIGLSPRLAMVWTPRRDQALRASAGRAYRKPSFFESHLSFRFTPGDEVPGEIASRLQYLFAVDAPNPNLGNETVTAVEAGWLGRFLGGRLVTSADLYHLSFEQRIEGILENIEFIPGLGGSVSLHPDARISYANQEMPQWALGGELAVSARPNAWLRLDAHYSHQGIFDVEDGERVSTISTWTPQHRLNLAVRLDLSGGLRLGISAHWCSAFTRYLQDPESSLYPLIYQEIGNQVLMLGSLSYRLRLPRGEVEVGVGGRNLLFAELRESPGISTEEGAWGGEILRPSARLFVRGRF
jgi:outer membrane receptor protein involved in Fe transport